jgi:hypothetical protein
VPIPRREGLRELLGFAQETGVRDDAVEARRRGGVRERWLFATEREVVAAFGVPDELVLNDNSEVWTYLLPTTNDEESDRIVLVFSRGRLLQAW